MNDSASISTRSPALTLLLALFISLLFTAGCAHYPVNARLANVDPRAGYRFQNAVAQTNSDDLLLALAFSGGGTRASALSYGVLQELAQTKVGTQACEHRLLNDVGLISSVSGGSFTAAYYALWGNRIFSDYESRFLKKHVQTGLLLRMLAPWNQVRLASWKFDRSDLVAEYYDRLLFQGATFGDLTPKPGRPFLVMNATDLAIGARFEFTQDQFDLLQSDLSRFPISRAVGASSAFPILLSPIVLKNHSTDHPVAEPDDFQSVLSDPTASSRLKNLALQARSYVDGDRRKFVHLIDGGITDNLGLRGLAERALELQQPGTTMNATLKLPHRVAIIIVDANTATDYGWDANDYSRGMKALLGSIEQIAVSRYSFETVELFREVSARLARERGAVRVAAGSSPTDGVEFYIIELHFNQLANDSDRRFFNSVPTKLQLPSSTVDRLERLARQELRNNPEFRRLIAELRRAPSTPIATLTEAKP
jgi:NTE family protein